MDDQPQRTSPPRPQPQPQPQPQPRAPLHPQHRSDLDTNPIPYPPVAPPLRGYNPTNGSNIGSSSAGTAPYPSPSPYHLPRLTPSSGIRQEPPFYPPSHPYSVSVRNEPEAGPSSQPYQGNRFFDHRPLSSAGTPPALHSPGSIPYAGHSGARNSSYSHPRDSIYQSLPPLRSDHASSSRLPGVRSTLPKPPPYASSSAIPLPPPPPPPPHPQSSEMPGPIRFASPAPSMLSSSSDDSMGYAGHPRDPAYSPDLSDSEGDADNQRGAGKRRKSATTAIPKTTATVRSKAKAKAKADNEPEEQHNQSEHGSESGKATAHTRKMPDGHIKRPPNAFMLFRSYIQTKDVIPKSEKDQSNASRIAGMMWRSINEVERAEWYAQAERAKELHALKYPNYKYKPAKRETNLPRRRMKKKSGAQEHCAQLADGILRSHGVAEGLTKDLPAPRSASKSKSASPDPATAGQGRGTRRGRGAEDEGADSAPSKRSKGNGKSKSTKAPSQQQSAASDDSEDDDSEYEEEGNQKGKAASKRGTAASRGKRATGATSSRRKSSLGYVIPPARKRSPVGATSTSSTPTITPSQLAPSPSLSSSTTTERSKADGLRPIVSSATLMQISRPFGHAGPSSSTGLGIGLGQGFGTAGGSKALGARLGIHPSFAEPISPTTIPPSMANHGTHPHTSDELMFLEARGVASRAGANVARQNSPHMPLVPFLPRSMASSTQFHTFSMANQYTDRPYIVAPSTVERTPAEVPAASRSAESSNAPTSGPLSKVAAFEEDDIKHYAPELFPQIIIDNAEGNEDGAGNGDDDADMDDTDGFAAALAAAHFDVVPTASPAPGPSTSGPTDFGVGPEKRNLRSIFSPPLGAPSSSGKLSPNPLPGLHEMISAAEAAERRRSTVTNIKTQLDSFAHREAERIMRQPHQQQQEGEASTSSSVAPPSSFLEKSEDKARKLSEIKHDLLRQWQTSFQSARPGVSNEDRPALTNNKSWMGGPFGFGIGEPSSVPYGSSGGFDSAGFIRPTAYWSDSRPAYTSDDPLARPGQLGIGLDYGSNLGLSMGRRSGYGVGLDMTYINMRTTGYAPSAFGSHHSEAASDDAWMRPSSADSETSSMRSFMAAPSTTGVISPLLLHTPPVLPVDSAAIRAGCLPGVLNFGSNGGSRFGLQTTLANAGSSSSSSYSSLAGASPEFPTLTGNLNWMMPDHSYLGSHIGGTGRFREDLPAPNQSAFWNQYGPSIMSEAFNDLLGSQ
ncbi:hypothetical protein A4X09_0g5441 [Tilletia walkeri]|uniref:HMG box domain-containing protein n=1 Tax=Tilletia walkeri TaxID=117179 RepID=A0A8X7N7D5_9BASI|nr:hypothetical protein A4X09_0g5441 [Tilletia walkeri]